MPSMRLEYQHTLEQKDAERRIKNLLSEVQKDYAEFVSDVHETWSDNQLDFKFKAAGFKIDGILDVQPSAVKLNGNIPITLIPVKRKIEKIISEKMHELLR